MPVDAGPQTPFELAVPFSTISHADWVVSVQTWLRYGVPLLGEQTARPCPACGAISHRPLFTSYDGYPFSECLDCSCWYVALRVDQALFDRFFALCPEAKEIARRSFDKRASQENLSLDLGRIGGYLDTLLQALEPGADGIRYLDIGAGTGSSLLAARERNVSAVGVEIDPRALEVALSRGVDIRIPGNALPDGPFHLISLWESLEHISDPLATLLSAADRLAPGGLLAITVPNRDSPMAQLMRGDCEFMGGGTDSPGHINMFGIAQLERLFERAGFRLLDVDGQYGSNLLELAGYALGRHRGAASLLETERPKYNLASPLATVLASAGPAAALFEREARLAPILFAVAAREDDLQSVASVAAKLAEQRRVALSTAFEGLMRRRDDLIQALQAEVSLRDEMLQKLQDTATDLQERLHQSGKATRLRKFWWR
jgi:SAM-dependent methyltransferase